MFVTTRSICNVKALQECAKWVLKVNKQMYACFEEIARAHGKGKRKCGEKKKQIRIKQGR